MCLSDLQATEGVTTAYLSRWLGTSEDRMSLSRLEAKEGAVDLIPQAQQKANAKHDSSV